jgi:hypothetical protein
MNCCSRRDPPQARRHRLYRLTPPIGQQPAHIQLTGRPLVPARQFADTTGRADVLAAAADQIAVAQTNRGTWVSGVAGMYWSAILLSSAW